MFFVLTDFFGYIGYKNAIFLIDQEMPGVTFSSVLVAYFDHCSNMLFGDS